MASTMHAAAVEQLGQPLMLRRAAIPSPGAGQNLVKTEACGRLERLDAPSPVVIDLAGGA